MKIKNIKFYLWLLGFLIEAGPISQAATPINANRSLAELTPTPWSIVHLVKGRCSALMPNSVPGKMAEIQCESMDEKGGRYHLGFDDDGDIKPENLQVIAREIAQKVSDKTPLPHSFQYKGYPAVEYQLESNVGNRMALRFILVHARLYEMSYTAPVPFFDSGRALMFLDSLKIFHPGLDDLQEGKVEKIEISDYGLYTVGRGPKVQGLSRDHRGVYLLEGYRLEAQTTEIKARIGESFGFSFVTVGEPVGQPVRLRFVYLFPKAGLKDPAKGKVTQQMEYFSAQVIGEESHISYAFDHDWELVPGDWTIQIWKDDRKLAEKTFHVVNENDNKRLNPGIST